MMRDLDIAGPHTAMDGRRLEVIADGLPLFEGAQLALDTTMVSPLHSDGTAKRGTSVRGGAVLQEARRRKERTFAELNGAGGRARLVVLAAEVGGRWSDETTQFLRVLAKHRPPGAPGVMRQRVQSAWLRRWGNLLACNAAKAFALSLLDRRPPLGAGGDAPSVHEVVRDRLSVFLLILITISFHE